VTVRNAAGVLVLAAVLPGATVLVTPRLAHPRRREETVHG
jgi:hypothetical protein